MPRYMYERLSAQDNSFLVAERHQHTAAYCGRRHLRAGPRGHARRGRGHPRMFRRFIEARLHEIPRYRQKLMWVPIESRPVWIDDPHFNIDYHIRHAALPRPGGVEELKKLTARITTRTLDRSRPLWEIWVIEGLDGRPLRDHQQDPPLHGRRHGRGRARAGAQLALSRVYEIPEPQPYMPRPAPREAELFYDAAQRMLGTPLRALRGLASLPADPVTGALEEAEARVRALADIVRLTVQRSSQTPLNGPLGPHRRVDWLTLPLDDVKAVRHELDCTVNDVVLATVTGRGSSLPDPTERRPADDRLPRVGARQHAAALPSRGRWAIESRRGSCPFRSGRRTRSPGRAEFERPPRQLKQSRQALGVEMMMQAAEYAPSSLLALGMPAPLPGPINVVVTNVPGPTVPALHARRQAAGDAAPRPAARGDRARHRALQLRRKAPRGLNADYELVPDLETFTALFAQSFMALSDAAGIEAVERNEPAGHTPVAEAASGDESRSGAGGQGAWDASPISPEAASPVP